MASHVVRSLLVAITTIGLTGAGWGQTGLRPVPLKSMASPNIRQHVRTVMALMEKVKDR